MLKLYKNIYIPPKSPFDKGGLGRFAPGAKIKRVSWLTQYKITAKSKSEFARRLFCVLFCRQNVLEMLHHVESPAMDSTKTYSHCWAFRDVPYMTHFHDKITTK